MAWWNRGRPREGGKAFRSPARSFGDFNRSYAPRYARGFSYREEDDFGEVLRQRFRPRAERDVWEHEDLREILRVPFRSSFNSTNFGAKSRFKFSPAAFRSSLAAAEFRLNDPTFGGQPSVLTTDRLPDLSDGRTRADNRVAQNLKLLAKAQAADSRQFDPEGFERPARTIYGTVAERWHHPLTVAPVLRRLKRREVLFAKRKIGRK